MTPQLDHHIAELLALYDCVIVPDLGGFVSHPVPARHDEASRTFYPPSKALSFNRQLQQNDGLLADHIARAQDIKYAAALHQIRENVLAWQIKLKAGERLEFAHTGVLYLDQEQNLQFIADQRHNHQAASFGLNPVQVALPAKSEVVESTPVVKLEKPIAVTPAVVTEVPSEVAEKEEKKVVPIVKIAPKHDPKVVVLGTNEPRRRRWPLLAAASVVLIGAFYTWHIPSNTDYRNTGNLEWAHLNPFRSNTSVQVIPASYEPRTESYEASADEFAPFFAEQDKMAQEHQVFIDTKEAEAIAAATPAKVAEPVKMESVADASLSYHLIANCFRDKANAETFVQQMQSEGLAARIVDQSKGLWRVSVGDYASRGEASAALTLYSTNGRSAWVLKQ